MADRRAMVLGVMASGLILLLAAAGILMLASPQTVRGQLGFDASPAGELSDEEALLAEDLLAEFGGIDVLGDDDHLRQWQQMEPAARRVIEERYMALRWLSIAGRRALVDRYVDLQQLEPQERAVMRQQAETLAAFEKTLGRQDHAALEGFSAAERARALLVLWREAQGLQ